LRPIIVLIILLLSPALPAAAPPEGEEWAQAMRKINLAGRQRMLSQRIAMAVCLTRFGAEPERNAAVAAAAEDLFARTLAGLRSGDPHLGLEAENHASVLAALDAVDALWPGYRAAAAALREGEARANPLTALRAQAGHMLRATDTVVGRLEAVYGEGLIPPDRTTTVNVAGRQRMLIQKAMMEACFAAATSEREASHRPEVAATTSLFEQSLADLLIGNEAGGIVPPPNAEIDIRLVRVVRLWRWLGADLDALAEGADMDASQLAQLARAAEVVLVTMNEAVSLYEAL